MTEEYFQVLKTKIELVEGDEIRIELGDGTSLTRIFSGFSPSTPEREKLLGGKVAARPAKIVFKQTPEEWRKKSAVICFP